MSADAERAGDERWCDEEMFGMSVREQENV